MPRADRVDRGVVDQHVGAAERVARGVGDRLRGALVRDVDLDGDRLPAGRDDPVGHLAQPLALQTGGDDARTPCREQLRGRAADPRRRARDDGDPAFDGHASILSDRLTPRA